MSDNNSWVDLFSCLIIFSFDIATYPWDGFQPDECFYSFLELFPLVICLCGNILHLYHPKVWVFDEKMPLWVSLVHAPWYVLNYKTFFVFMKILYSIIHIPNIWFMSRAYDCCFFVCALLDLFYYNFGPFCYL